MLSSILTRIILLQADELKKHSFELDFGLDFYTDVLDLEYLLDILNEGSFTSKFKKLNKALVSLIEDYGLVSFIPLNVSSEQSLLTLKSAVDKVRFFCLEYLMIFNENVNPVL